MSDNTTKDFKGASDKDKLDIASIDLATLSDEQIAKLSAEDTSRLQLKSIADNTKQTVAGNKSQLQQNGQDVADRLDSAQVGLQRAWGDAIFSGVEVISSFATQRGQQAMRPLMTGLKTIFSAYMALKEQNRSLNLSEKQKLGVELKMIESNINPDNSKQINSFGEKADLLEERLDRVKKYLDTDKVKRSEEILAEIDQLRKGGVPENAANTGEDPARKPAAPMAPAA